MFPQSYNQHLFEMAKERHAQMVKEAELSRVLADNRSHVRALPARWLIKSQVMRLAAMVEWLRVRRSAPA